MKVFHRVRNKKRLLNHRVRRGRRGDAKKLRNAIAQKVREHFEYIEYFVVKYKSLLLKNARRLNHTWLKN